MKKYLNLQDFISFIKSLEEDKPTKLFTKSVEDGSIDSYIIMKLQFAKNTVVLYEIYAGGVGIIQDTPVAPWEDYAEGVYEDLTMNNEYKLFIESEKL